MRFLCIDQLINRILDGLPYQGLEYPAPAVSLERLRKNRRAAFRSATDQRTPVLLSSDAVTFPAYTQPVPTG